MIFWINLILLTFEWVNISCCGEIVFWRFRPGTGVFYVYSKIARNSFASIQSSRLVEAFRSLGLEIFKFGPRDPTRILYAGVSHSNIYAKNVLPKTDREAWIDNLRLTEKIWWGRNHFYIALRNKTNAIYVQIYSQYIIYMGKRTSSKFFKIDPFWSRRYVHAVFAIQIVSLYPQQS